MNVHAIFLCQKTVDSQLKWGQTWLDTWYIWHVLFHQREHAFMKKEYETTGNVFINQCCNLQVGMIFSFLDTLQYMPCVNLSNHFSWYYLLDYGQCLNTAMF